MYIESLNFTSFRCFGPQGQRIDLEPGLTAFVGANGTGKTALMQAMLRLFGITADQRRVRRQDFHVPAVEDAPVLERALAIEAILAFPELDDPADDDSAIPEFFHQMAADDAGRLKCRIRLEATWMEDGTADGAIEQKTFVVRTFGEFTEGDVSDLKATDRTRIQMIYVPASRDGSSQVAAFLRGRLWRAINWSGGVRDAYTNASTSLNTAFAGEPAVTLVRTVITQRWQEVHSGGTDTTPLFRTVDSRFDEFIRGVEIVFHPDEAGRERALDELSDGQRSLFHLALTAATLDTEAQVASDPTGSGFLEDGLVLPALTIIAVEEPENNLAPFYLSRIVKQIETLVESTRAQAVLSSHSASILARVAPTQVRHFRLDERTAIIRAVTVPTDMEEAAKYVREAVRSYPELYFAKFVILGEGASEEVVLPRLASALGCEIDRSFVAVVPLGGRHVNHLWRLLSNLSIPHATLVDLDWGRPGGGWGRIKYACSQLAAVGVERTSMWSTPGASLEADLAAFDAWPMTDTAMMRQWLSMLERLNVFFSQPLDLDYSMLKAYAAAYRVLDDGATGPSPRGEARDAVLGDGGHHTLYDATHDDDMRWYRYLFLGRGKPSTHVRALGALSNEQLRDAMPAQLAGLLRKLIEALAVARDDGL
jgi:putative ATP-dependent endonuclease of OLD family